MASIVCQYSATSPIKLRVSVYDRDFMIIAYHRGSRDCAELASIPFLCLKVDVVCLGKFGSNQLCDSSTHCALAVATVNNDIENAIQG